jgi:hypothetical protein
MLIRSKVRYCEFKLFDKVALSAKSFIVIMSALYVDGCLVSTSKLEIEYVNFHGYK